MHRAIGPLTQLFAVATLAGCSAPSSHMPDGDSAGLTVSAARSLSDTELSTRLTSGLTASVVDVDRGPLVNGSLSDLGLGLRPKLAWNGVCEGQVLQFRFDESSGSPDEGRLPDSVRSTSRYKIRGIPDQNAGQDGAQTAALCAKDRSFKDGYFSAPDGLTAQDAGHIVLTAQAQANTGRLTFALECKDKETCKAALDRIKGFSTDRILMVTRMDDCAAGKDCLEIMFSGPGRCYEIWSAVGRHRTEPGQKWGKVSLTNLRLKAECPGPAL